MTAGSEEWRHGLPLCRVSSNSSSQDSFPLESGRPVLEASMLELFTVQSPSSMRVYQVAQNLRELLPALFLVPLWPC